MAVLVTKPAPDFTAEAVLKDGSFAKLSLSQFKGKYVLLFFYPLDFTFVCPTEIIAFSERIKDFNDLGVEVIGVSVDSHFSHLAWRNVPRDQGGIGPIQYSLVADLDKQIATIYPWVARSTKRSEWFKPSNLSRKTEKFAQPTGKKANGRSSLVSTKAKSFLEPSTRNNTSKTDSTK
jgi:alkyl hydroperoxide reductase subunit AhpC